jgi:hypothetical protein
MKTILLILAFTATSHAQLSFLGRNGPDGVCRLENGVLQCYPQPPQAVPEPSSPLVMLVSAGLALIGRRSRKPGRGKWIREKRIDLRTVRML